MNFSFSNTPWEEDSAVRDYYKIVENSTIRYADLPGTKYRFILSRKIGSSKIKTFCGQGLLDEENLCDISDIINPSKSSSKIHYVIPLREELGRFLTGIWEDLGEFDHDIFKNFLTAFDSKYRPIFENNVVEWDNKNGRLFIEFLNEHYNGYFVNRAYQEAMRHSFLFYSWIPHLHRLITQPDRVTFVTLNQMNELDFWEYLTSNKSYCKDKDSQSLHERWHASGNNNVNPKDTLRNLWQGLSYKQYPNLELILKVIYSNKMIIDDLMENFTYTKYWNNEVNKKN